MTIFTEILKAARPHYWLALVLTSVLASTLQYLHG